ncbi:hypothetical protein IV417_18500 [Alphaproteobacteria bacterium KMM 3653]|uniref:Uncharacterized protein n=1 Tax=Harenicola maris TaxID=2841044 RepID=A0AAP2CTP4_9RHOB|nr:hypothetical protein [Harenicola maris]
MFRFLTGVFLCAGLAGCLGGVAPTEPTPVVLEAPETRDEGTPAPAPEDVARALPEDLARADEVEPAAPVEPAVAKPGLFQRVFGGAEEAEAPAPVEVAEGEVVEGEEVVASVSETATDVASAEEAAANPVPQLVGLVAPAPEAVGVDAEVGPEVEVEVAAVEPAPAPVKQAGLFGFLRRGTEPAEAVVTHEETASDAPVTAAVQAPEAEVQTASLAPEPSRKQRRNARASRKAKVPSVPVGIKLPFGEVGMQCNVSGRALGKQIDTSSAKHKLYDSAPGTSGPRTFYVTGFKDHCARQFTASLALFGDLQLYELMHFGGGGGSGGAETDKAYSRLRSGACKSRNAPCAASGLNRLGKDTAFLSVYPTEGARSHMEVLLSKGDLTAKALK